MLQRCLRNLRNFFGFTRGETIGFSLVALLLLLVYVGWFIYGFFPAAPYQPQADQQQLDSLISLLEHHDSLSQDVLLAKEEPEAGQTFFFNPNTLSQDSLQLLGFPAFLAQRLVNYRNKGGRFRQKEDLKKLYGIREELYDKLLPFIQIPETQRPKQYANMPAGRVKTYADKPETRSREKLQPFDLNLADSMQLIAVRGIGPVLSGRILKFRNALGGFAHAEQLREVWGLSPEAAEALLAAAYVGAEPALRLLPVNAADASQLAAHPYISPGQARQIVAYRMQHGPFKNAEDFKSLHGLDEDFINKIKPYLQF